MKLIFFRFICVINDGPYTLLYKKLIRRWDSERELSLRRHRARTTKYNWLVHKFRHRSTRLCVGTHVFTKFSEITQYNGHYAVQGHSRSPILVPIESSYDFLLILPYLLYCTVSRLWLIIRQIFASERECLTLSLSLGIIPCQYRHK